MTNVPLVFCDTETTGLSFHKQVWDVAMIRDNPDGTTEREQFFLEVDQTDSLLFEFSEEAKKHSHWERYAAAPKVDEDEAVRRINHIFRDRAHFVGMVPDFDASALWKILREYTPVGAGDGSNDRVGFPWYYQLIDVDNMAHGYCLAYAQLTKKLNGGSSIFSDIWKDLATLPLDTDQFSNLIGVEKPTDEERHTAMGDAIWIRSIYYAMHEMPVPNA